MLAEIHSSYMPGIKALAAHLNTTEAGVINSLIYKGLREALTDDVLASAVSKEIETIKRQLKLA